MRGLTGGAMRDDDPLDPFHAAMQSRDRDIPNLVATALAANRAQLAFQPVVRATATGTISFYEGLIRIHDDQGRVLPAARFMPDVEDTEIGREIDCAALRLGLHKLRQNPRLRLSVNMSARSMADSKWRRILHQGLRATDGIGHRLILEIGESSAMALPEVVMRFMADMQPRGICFALDDFGAGMTAFRHLKDFFFDLVKIDRHFVADIDTSPDNQVLAEALITVAHQFEMFAVAEGVETREEAALLADLGVDCLQGYLFGQPRPTL